MLRAADFASASCPFDRCPRKAGSAIAARMPMIKMTTRSSISVKPCSPLWMRVLMRLPLPIARARALVRVGARTSDRAARLGDHEFVARGGMADHDVAVRAGGLEARLARVGTQDTDLLDVVGVGADVRLVRRVEGLESRDQVARRRLGRRVLSLLTLAEEGRQGDRGQDADDQDHDEELDQREAPLPFMYALTELPRHDFPL